MNTAQRVESAADRAHASIRSAIMRGEFTPGTMLSENELASSLSMSRTPVRAALTRLQDEGWVTIYAQRGALVRDLSPEEIRESAEVRRAFETAGVQAATSRARSRLADGLAENLDQQQRALRDDDFSAFASLASRFHRAFVELAENTMMLTIYDRLQDRQQMSILRSAGRITDEPEQVVDEHRALLQHAIDGDWITFALRLQDHQDRSHRLESGLHD